MAALEAFINFLKWLISFTGIPNLVLILFFIIFLLLIAASAYFGRYWIIDTGSDKIIIFDKAMRWKLINSNLKERETVNVNNKKYHCEQDSIYLGQRGKFLGIWFTNKPEPLNIKPNKLEWIHSDTLQSIFNNEKVKQVVQDSDSVKDMLVIIGSVCAIVSALVGIFIALKMFGVLK